MATAAGMVRISNTAKQQLRDLAEREKVPMQTVLDRAIESYRRQRFLDAANQSYADLRNNPKAWSTEAEERDDWDRTIGDDIDGS